jgi:hypothetical protein
VADRRPIAVAFGCLLAAALALSGLTYVRQGASSQAALLYDEA